MSRSKGARPLITSVWVMMSSHRSGFGYLVFTMAFALFIPWELYSNDKPEAYFEGAAQNRAATTDEGQARDS